MAINVHIENLNIDTFTVSDEIARGSSPETLRSVGLPIAEDAPETVVSDSPTLPNDPDTIETSPTLFDDYRAVQEAEAAENDELEASVDGIEPIGDHVKPRVRRRHLYKAIITAGKLRRITGAVTTHQETSIEDMDAAEDALEGYEESFEKSLEKACARCPHSGDCRLENNPEAWLRRHPHGERTRKDQETIEAFVGRLDSNPMAHCMTPGYPQRLLRITHYDQQAA